MEPEKFLLEALGEVVAIPPWELWPVVQPMVEFVLLAPLVMLALALAWHVLSVLESCLAWLCAVLWRVFVLRRPMPRRWPGADRAGPGSRR